MHVQNLQVASCDCIMVAISAPPRLQLTTPYKLPPCDTLTDATSLPRLACEISGPTTLFQTGCCSQIKSTCKPLQCHDSIPVLMADIAACHHHASCSARPVMSLTASYGGTDLLNWDTLCFRKQEYHSQGHDRNTRCKEDEGHVLRGQTHWSALE